MRIVSIGCPVPSPNVDNHSIANAPSIFDYDACIFDPQSVSEQIEGIAASALDVKAHDGRAITQGESGAFHFGLAELLQQRQLEFQLLLEHGGVLVVFVYPNVRHPNVAAFPGLNRYSLIPGPDGDPFSWPALRPADGKDVRPTLAHHAASAYLDELSGRLRYRAIFDLGASDGGTVVGRSVGGAAVAAEFRVGPGRIVALPPADSLSTSQRKLFGSVLLEMLERLVQEPAQQDAPVWVRRYDTPEASEARDGLTAAKDELKQAQRRVTEAESLVADTTHFQRMLWQSQSRAFQDVIQDAFRLLGYSVSTTDDGMELRDGGDMSVVEIASANEALSDRLYLTLQGRIEEHFLRRKSRPKGIIVGNGFRQTDPRIRREPFPKTLVDACETYDYALIPVEALYDLVTFASETSDEPELLAEVRRSIAEAVGVLEIALEDEVEEETEEDADDSGTVAADNSAVAAPVEAD
ncbi:MAG: hypothetical protein OXS30_08320 [Chloroflexota bacterium]|nr:hypothetical protein [Chloroflexota bacterium]